MECEIALKICKNTYCGWDCFFLQPIGLCLVSLSTETLAQPPLPPPCQHSVFMRVNSNNMMCPYWHRIRRLLDMSLWIHVYNVLTEIFFVIFWPWLIDPLRHKIVTSFNALQNNIRSASKLSTFKRLIHLHLQHWFCSEMFLLLY